MKTMQMVMCGILPCAMVLTGCVSNSEPTNSEPTIITRWLTREVEVVKRDVARENDIILRETKKIQGEIAVLIEKGDFATARKMLCEAKPLGIANVDASLASVRYELLVKVVEEEGKAIKKRLIDAAESAMKTDSLKVCEEGRALLKNLPAEPVAAVSMSLALQAADKGVSPNLAARRQKMNAELLQLRRVLLARVEGWLGTLRFRAALAVARKTGVDFSQELVWTESAFSPDGKGRIEPAVTKRIRAEYAHLVRMLKDGFQIDGNQKTDLLVGAVVSGRDAVAKWCLSELKVSIDAVSDLDNMKRIPLLWALAGSHVETVEVVWKNKPGLELVGANGDSALHYAVRRGDARDISPASAQNLIEGGMPMGGRRFTTPLTRVMSGRLESCWMRGRSSTWWTGNISRRSPMRVRAPAASNWWNCCARRVRSLANAISRWPSARAVCLLPSGLSRNGTST